MTKSFASRIFVKPYFSVNGCCCTGGCCTEVSQKRANFFFWLRQKIVVVVSPVMGVEALRGPLGVPNERVPALEDLKFGPLWSILAKNDHLKEKIVKTV